MSIKPIQVVHKIYGQGEANTIELTNRDTRFVSVLFKIKPRCLPRSNKPLKVGKRALTKILYHDL